MHFSGTSLVARQRSRFDTLANIRAQTVVASSSSSLGHHCAPETARV